ncbi:MAG: RNA-directed polymerase [Planctomycetota bacterium]|nr:RNA-directed polymerase [Planctomycetota bacterium]
MPGTPGPETISTRRQRIAELAKQSPQAAFTTLAHHIDVDWLFEAYLRTRKDGAVGVDGTDGFGLCGRPGGESRVAAGSGQVRTLPRAARAAGAHPERDRLGDQAHRHPDVRG